MDKWALTAQSRLPIRGCAVRDTSISSMEPEPVTPKARGRTDSERDTYRIDFDASAWTIAGEQDVHFGQTHAVRQAATLAAIRESHELATLVRA